MVLSGKHAAVTGGGSGIGLFCVKKLLSNGVKACAILEIDPIIGEESRARLASEFGEKRVIFVKCDVSNKDSFEEALKTILKKIGSLDILVNNAGLANETIDHWEHLVSTNLNGVISGTLLAIKYMGKHNGGNGGTVVNVSSILGLVPAPIAPVYSATKFAINGFTRSMGTPLHFNKNGVNVMALCPGPTQTSLFANIADGMDEHTKTCFLAMAAEHGNMQEPENVAEGLIEVLKHGKNGSIWAVFGNKAAIEVNFPETNEILKMA